MPEDKRMRPLRLRKKIYEFFTAPITKFWADSVSVYLFFLKLVGKFLVSFFIIFAIFIDIRFFYLRVVSRIMRTGKEDLKENVNTLLESKEMKITHSRDWESNLQPSRL